MLLPDVTTLKNYVGVSQSFDINAFRPYITKAAREYVKPYAGLIYEEIADTPLPGDENETIINEAREYLEDSLANFGLYKFMSFGTVNITGTGITVAKRSDQDPADHFRINDLKRALLRDGHKALDMLLAVLEANTEVFSSYTAEYQNKAAELLVQNVASFEKWYYLHGSRQTYLSLVPTMRAVEGQYIESMLCDEFVTKVKAADASGFYLEARELLHAAVVAFTVSKAVLEGQFILSDNGIYLKFDALPHEKGTVFTTKDNGFLKETALQKQKAGYEYLRRLDALIKANLESITECDGQPLLYEKETDNTDSGNGGILFNDGILSI
jgi:hypothetical protein